MDKKGCMIAYPVDEHKKSMLRSAIGLGVNKLIFAGESGSCKDFFSDCGFITDVRPILTDDVGLVVSSMSDIISEARRDHDEVSVLLMPSDPVISTGMYVSACMEKVKVFTPLSNFEMKYLDMPLFPFLNISKDERFVLAKILKKKEMNTRKLLAEIKNEGHYDILFSKRPDFEVDEKSALRQLQRILKKLEALKLVSKEKKGRFFIWKSTSFSSMIFEEKSG